MKSKMLSYVYLILLLTTLTLFGITIYRGENNLTIDAKNKSSISGLVTKCILVAFNHYTQGQKLEGFRKEIEYYNFEYFFETDNQIVIKIIIDQEKVLKKLNKPGFKCGEAIYTLDLNTQEIKQKVWYK